MAQEEVAVVMMKRSKRTMPAVVNSWLHPVESAEQQ